MSLSELAERCEQAPGPDIRLSGEIGSAVLGFPERPYQQRNGCRAKGSADLDRIEFAAGWFCNYTASLDAAVTLVPKGVDWSIGSNGTAVVGIATAHPSFSPPDLTGKLATTAALALCAAALRARAASGIDTRQSQDGETRLGPKDESPTAESGDAQRPPQ